MNTKTKWIWGGIVVVLIAIGACYWVKSMPSKSLYAVSTRSGAFFVGRVARVPFTGFITMYKPFVLQNVQGEDPTTVTPQLLDLSVESYWTPDKIRINIDDISFEGMVGADSPIATKVKEYESGKSTAPTNQE